MLVQVQKLTSCVRVLGVTMEAEAGVVWQSTASAEASFRLMHNLMCAKCLYEWVVRECVFCVCESFVLYIYTAQPRLQVCVDARPLHPAPNITNLLKPAHHLSSIRAGWCYRHLTQCAHSIYLLSDSQHSLQLRRSYSWVYGLSQFKEDTVCTCPRNCSHNIPAVSPTDWKPP